MNCFAEIISVCLIITGSIISVWFAAHEDKSYQLDEFFALYWKPAFIAFAICTMAVVSLMVSAIRHYNRLRTQALMDIKGSNQTLSLLEEGRLLSIDSVQLMTSSRK